MKIKEIIFTSILLLGLTTYGYGKNVFAQNNTLRMGFDPSYYPMTFYNQEHKLRGIDVDIANLVAKRLHMKIKWIASKRKNLITGLIKNNYDMIWSGFSITTNRKKKILFSRPYYSDHKRIIVNFESGAKIKTVCGLKVGIQLGSTAKSAGDNISCPLHKHMKFIYYNNNNQAFTDINKGKIQAIIVDTTYGLYYSSKHLHKYRMFPDPLNKAEHKAIAFNLQDSKLKNIIDKTIKYLAKNGDLIKISKKWTHNNILN